MSKDQNREVLQNRDALKDRASHAASLNAAANYATELSKLASIDGYCTDLPVELVDVRHNVRQQARLDPEFLESVRAQGVLQPILVSVIPGKTKDAVVCIAGHRRLAAAKEVGMPTIKVVSRKLPGKAAIIAALSENVNRSALHPLDLADSFQELVFQGSTRQEMEGMFNRDRKTIARFLKMATWTAETKELIRQHPEFFSSRFLLALASKRTTAREIETIVRNLIEGKPRVRAVRQSAKVTMDVALESFFAAHDCDAKQRQLVMDALRHLKLFPGA